MNESVDDDLAKSTKRPPISLPFLVIVPVLGLAAYLTGPWVMKMVMYAQEQRRVNAGPIAPKEFADLPDLALGASAGFGAPTGGEGRGGEGEGRGGGTGVDPAGRFAERDVDGSGMLEGDEISDGMRQRLAQIDNDQDGAITEQEFVAAMERRRDRRGGPSPPSGADDQDTTPEVALPQTDVAPVDDGDTRAGGEPSE